MSLELTENSLLVLRKRILAHDDSGEVSETPAQMFERVAKSIAAAELQYGTASDAQKAEQAFFDVMTRLEFLPNSPTLMNAGRNLGQLSACFVLPIDDSMESIFDTLADTALIQKTGGGTGFSFSRLRPKADKIESTQGESSGPVSFIRLYNCATEVTRMGGKRAGANMAILRVDHPDIQEFIAAKTNPIELNTFNISVAVTNHFMERVKTGGLYELINPRTGLAVSHLDPKTIFNQIVESAWHNGEPGVIFIDRINRDNPTPALGLIESTNPCGEQPLLAYESCVLGSINLSRFVRGGDVDYDRLTEVVSIGVHFLDNIIDVSEFPVTQIKDVTRANRKIGLGVMGWADLLIDLGIPYDSEEAIVLAEQVMRFISQQAKKTSIELAKKRGPFPRWFHETIYKNTTEPARRNATITTVAPTGTISLIANCSSGIEPIYSVAYQRISFESDKMVFVNPMFEQYARTQGFYTDRLMERIAEEGSLHNIAEIPPQAKRLFVTTHDIAPEWHVRMQAAFQKHIDAAVSKTINFPTTATVQDVSKAYLLAYELGCKGITIYRDGSRENQVLSSKSRDLSRAAPFPAVSTPETQLRANQLLADNVCPDCTMTLQHNGGCVYCSCGFSVCLQT